MDILEMTATPGINELKTFRIIEQIKKHRCIWDNTDKDKLNATKVREAWALISQTTGIKMDKVKTKWKKLQDIFYSGDLRNDDIILRSYLESMKFLNSCRGSDASQNLNGTNLLMEIPIENENEENGYSNSMDSQVKMNTSKISNVIRKRKHENDVAEDLSNASLIDGDYLFLVSLLPTLKKLPDDSKMNIRIKIQELIYKELHSYKREYKNNSYQCEELE